MKLDPATLVVFGALAYLGLADVALGFRHQLLITDFLRAHKAVSVGFLGVLTLHVLDVLGRLDPFDAAAYLLAIPGRPSDLQGV
jgi:hypothetical protein